MNLVYLIQHDRERERAQDPTNNCMFFFWWWQFRVGIQPGFSRFPGQHGPLCPLMAVELAKQICKALKWITILGILMGEGTHALVLRLTGRTLLLRSRVPCRGCSDFEALELEGLHLPPRPIILSPREEKPSYLEVSMGQLPCMNIGLSQNPMV